MTNTTKDPDRTSRTWFITGATSGIGREIAAGALERGDRVAAVARRPDPLADLGDRHPGTLLVLAADVSDEQSVRDAVSATLDTFGGIDIVANNAGFGLFGAVEEATDQQARAIFDTNVFGVLNVLRATLPVLRAQRHGHVLQGSSFYGQTAHPGVGLLAASKYAVEGLTDALVGEIAPLGVHVTLVQPGSTATAFLANLDFADTLDDYDASVRAVQKSLGEMAPESFSSPAAVARAVLAATDTTTPPRRLALGSQAEQDMRTALEARLTELDSWAELTRSVDA